MDLGGEREKNQDDFLGAGWMDGALSQPGISGIGAVSGFPELHFEQVKLEILLDVQMGFQGGKGPRRRPGLSETTGRQCCTAESVQKLLRPPVSHTGSRTAVQSMGLTTAHCMTCFANQVIDSWWGKC